MQRTLARYGALLSLAMLLAVAGCGSKGPKQSPKASSEELFEKANTYLTQGSYDNAITFYESLIARYPFSDYARQAQLDLIFAYYQNEEPESALDAADQFIKENPTHPRVDYAYYMKGLALFDPGPNIVEKVFRADLSNRPPTDARESFSYFSQLVEQFPNSIYAEDARQRMIYLRNRLANFEVEVAKYYIRRGAWVAALNRAKYAMENYDGAPAMRDALDVMITAYTQLDLPELAAAVETVRNENYYPQEQKSKSRFKWGRRSAGSPK